MRKKARPNLNSAVAIAKLLGTEGFTDHVANEVKRYAVKNHATEDMKRRWERIKKAFGAMVKEKLDDRDRIVLGKMIAVLSRLSFDTGLRIGLTASLFPTPGVEADNNP